MENSNVLVIQIEDTSSHCFVILCNATIRCLKYPAIFHTKTNGNSQLFALDLYDFQVDFFTISFQQNLTLVRMGDLF